MKRTQSVKNAFGGKLGGGGGVRETSWGTRPQGGKRGKDVNRERGGKILARKREKISGGKGLRRKRGEINDLNRELGGKDLREGKGS